jgi:large subunit ribosomal protein L30
LADKLRVTWKKSAIGYKENQKRTIEALGLRRLGHTVEHKDTRAIRGMIIAVRHLVQVDEISTDSAPDAALRHDSGQAQD